MLYEVITDEDEDKRKKNPGTDAAPRSIPEDPNDPVIGTESITVRQRGWDYKNTGGSTLDGAQRPKRTQRAWPLGHSATR